MISSEEQLNNIVSSEEMMELRLARLEIKTVEAVAAVTFAIRKLGDFLTNEVNLRIELRDAVRWLQDELIYIRSSIRAAEANPKKDYHTRVWINNVRAVANEAVNITAAPKKGVMDRMRSCVCVYKNEASFHDIGKEIEALKGRLSDIKNRRDEYNRQTILAATQKRQKILLRTTSFENQVDVIGFKEDMNNLLAQLVKQEPSLTMISILGMGGLGKTTLTRKLYHSTEVRQHFQNQAWVDVSQDYNINNVVLRLIHSLTNNKLVDTTLSETCLLRHLNNLLQQHRYLIVIDNVWDINAWKHIKKGLPDKKNGSRVIITTRDVSLAYRFDQRCYVHQLSFLTEDESWELFCGRTKPTRILEELGKKMVGRCGGLPLAVVVLSDLLLHKKSYEDWSNINEYMWENMKANTLRIDEILSLSYNDLPFQLRRCFLYLSRYPEGIVFRADKLIRLWIAEELIIEADGTNGLWMEDFAEEYLEELISRNLIQVATLRLNGKIWECRVHNMLRNLALQKAKEDKLMEVFNYSKENPNVTRLSGQPRHAIYNGVGKYLQIVSDDSILRSVAVVHGNIEFHTEKDRLVEIKVSNAMYSRFNFLKVLDLTDVVSQGTIPGEIGDLVLLNFLGLMGRPIGSELLVIPPTIGKLKKLQTLCSGSCKYIFPREICDLMELRHLLFPATYAQSGVTNLTIGSQQTKIQTLDTIWFDHWIHIDTVSLTKLRTLVLKDASTVENSYTLDSVANLTSLETFDLEIYINGLPTIQPLSHCKRLRRVSLYGPMVATSDLGFLPDSVTELVLRNNHITQDPMPIVGSLSSLTALHLEDYYGRKLFNNRDEFPSLQLLKLINARNLEEWKVEDGALPCLKGLAVKGCAMEMVPQQLQCLPPIPDVYFK